MGQQTFCNRCGVVRPHLPYSWAWDSLKRVGFRDYDLCWDCKDELTDFLKGKAVRSVASRALRDTPDGDEGDE